MKSGDTTIKTGVSEYPGNRKGRSLKTVENYEQLSGPGFRDSKQKEVSDTSPMKRCANFGYGYQPPRSRLRPAVAKTTRRKKTQNYF